MKKILILLFFSVIVKNVIAQSTIKGVVIDAENLEILPGATISWVQSKTGSISKQNGTFSLSKKIGEDLLISYIGYESKLISATQISDNETITVKLTRSIFQADEVVVNATRANNLSGIAFTNISKQVLDKQNNGQDLPFMLNQTASLVTTSDAGAGIGYTGLRIRGTDATRINVTVNGIPINDSESQGVFWVNMPDLASSVSSIQIQRGVGTSTNGAGAFGASVNIQSNEFNKEKYLEYNGTVGSFGTLKNNIKLGTGLINNKFTIDGRLSKIDSDGWVDRAFSDLRSYYISGAYFGKKSFVRLVSFGGKEKTYQSWNGIPEAKLLTDRRYNDFTYPNQTDNYTQVHQQLLSTHYLSKYLTLNANLHYTRGRGYYEEEKLDEKLNKYDVKYTSERTDLVRQKWLDNHFYGTTFSLDYAKGKATASLGGGYNIYDGDHFGDIIEAKTNTEIKGYRWYFNNTVKKDFNIYAKSTVNIASTTAAFVDLQLRSINLEMTGTGNKLQNLGQSHNYLFFNPKIGLTHSVSDKLQSYLSYSVGHKEPNRTDFVDNTANTLPRAEKLNDWETGIKYYGNNASVVVNGYFMDYQNQLVVTGAINETGEPIRTNIPESYRAGIEIEVGVNMGKKWNLAANTTLSRNKVKNFVELIPDYEGNYKTNNFKEADIAFSPNIISGATLTFKPYKSLEMSWLSKYVGKQYLDNTSNDNRKLDAFFTNDLRVLYQIKAKAFKNIGLGFYANNLLNHQYENNGYTYSYLYDNEVYTENFYYPQAGRNYMVTLQFRL